MQMQLPKSFTAKYRVIELIAAGGMGHVYRAEHKELKRPAAVKFLADTIIASRQSLQRFADEAKICSLLRHPNIVEIFDVDVSCDQPYIVFEYVEGSDFGELTNGQASFSLAEILGMMSQVANGLHFAHQKGVLHRDVKPDNILVTSSGQVKVTDFGIAKFGEVRTFKTKTGVILGTPRYMSPEQGKNEALTSATDVYSFGVVLFEAVTGVRPFEAPSEVEVLLQHINDEPPRASTINAVLPERLVELIARCLRKRACERPESAGEVGKILEDIATTIQDNPAENPTIVLSCRQGTLERPYTEASKRSASRAPSANVSPARASARRSRTSNRQEAEPDLLASGYPTRVRSAAAESTIFQGTSSSRRRLLLGVLLLLGIGLFVAIGIGGFFNIEEGRVAELTVVDKASRGAFLQWSASWHTAEPAVAIRDGSEDIVEYRSLRTSVVEGGELGYRYSLALAGLVPMTTYRVAVSKPDGSESLSVKLATGKERELNLRHWLAIAPAGEVSVELRASLPFSVEERDQFSLEGSLPLPFSRVERDHRLQATVLSLDGETQTIDLSVASALRDQAQRVYEDFRAGHDEGSLYRLFDGAKGTSLYLFREAARAVHTMRKKRGGVSKSWTRSFWRTLDERLAAHTWYADAVALAPGIAALQKRLSPKSTLRWGLERALLPLMAIDRAIRFNDLPLHPAWGRVLAKTIQSDLSAGKPFIEQPRIERVFQETGLFSYPQFPLIDWKHPKLAAMTSSREGQIATSRRERVLELKKSELVGLTEATLHIQFNLPTTGQTMIFEINDGAHVAFHQTCLEDFEHIQAWQKSDRFMAVGMAMMGGLGTAEQSVKDTIEGFFKFGPDLDEDNPWVKDYYIKIPVGALRPGTNKIVFQSIEAPDQYPSIAFIESVALRLR